MIGVEATTYQVNHVAISGESQPKGRMGDADVVGEFFADIVVEDAIIVKLQSGRRIVV